MAKPEAHAEPPEKPVAYTRRGSTRSAWLHLPQKPDGGGRINKVTRVVAATTMNPYFSAARLKQLTGISAYAIRIKGQEQGQRFCVSILQADRERMNTTRPQVP